jgi:hypothetical protein
MVTRIQVGYNVRNWATFEVKVDLTPEQRTLLEEAVDSDENDEALELANTLSEAGHLKLVENQVDDNPWVWGGTETGIHANIIDISEED